MRRYQVTKIIFGESINDVIDAEKGGEIIEITLKDDVKNYEDIGFTRTTGNK